MVNLVGSRPALRESHRLGRVHPTHHLGHGGDIARDPQGCSCSSCARRVCVCPRVRPCQNVFVSHGGSNQGTEQRHNLPGPPAGAAILTGLSTAVQEEHVRLGHLATHIKKG